jgi:DNA segregation ATPase FtsK/SpoIIIE-like protein
MSKKPNKISKQKVLTKKERIENKKLITKLIFVIEGCYASFGYQVKVVEVHVLEKIITFAIAIPMGTKIEKILKLDKDIALAISSPTGTVDIHTVPGRDLIFIDVPKGNFFRQKGKFKIIRIHDEAKEQVVRESEFYHDFKMLLRYILFKLGDLFYWLESKIPRKPTY